MQAPFALSVYCTRTVHSKCEGSFGSTILQTLPRAEWSFLLLFPLFTYVVLHSSSESRCISGQQ